MADQVIIEFVGDTTKLEEAYSKLQNRLPQLVISIKKALLPLKMQTLILHRPLNMLPMNVKSLMSNYAASIQL
jgi:hypothetical protein